MRHETRNCDIDLNVEPEDSQENTEDGLHVPDNDENGSNLEDNPHAHENDETDSNHNGDSHVQQDPHRNVVSNGTRRAIFEALFARARNGEASSDLKAEVSIQFSVHIRTVQCI